MRKNYYHKIKIINFTNPKKFKYSNNGFVAAFLSVGKFGYEKKPALSNL